MELKQIYDFVKQLEAFKEIERFRGQFFWRDYPQRDRYESTADHSWRMAMLAVLLQDKLAHPIDLEKALKMVLIHDLAEIISGDPSPLGEQGTGEDSHAYNPKISRLKYDQEAAAIIKLFSNLPTEIAKTLTNIWMEFEDGKTFEAQLVRALDKWEAKLQVLQYTKGKMFPQHLEFTLKYRDEYFDFDPAVRQLMDILIKDFHDAYKQFGQ